MPRIDNHSLTNNSCCDNMTDMELPITPPGLNVVVPMLFGFLMFVGVLGNGTLIFTVLRKKSMRNVPNILIVSLSTGDLMLLVLSAPISALYFAMDNYPFGTFICKMHEYLQTLSLGVSVFTLTALSGDRYVAIVYPMSKHKGKPTLKTIVMVAIIWTLSAIVAIPDAITAGVQTVRSTSFCLVYSYAEQWGLWYEQAHSMFRFVALFLIPLLIIGTFYFLMARILIKSSKQMPCETTKGPGLTQQQQRQIEARMKVARVVLSFVFLFVLCWLPRHVYLLWYFYGTSDFNMFWLVFKIAGFCLTYVYSCVNPYALYFLSSQFRKYYNRYLFRCCPRSYRLRDASSSGISTVRRGSTSMSMIKSNSDLQ